MEKRGMVGEKLKDFMEQVKATYSSGIGGRPFVCDGNPFKCDVFLVGLNPVTESSGDFWDYWNDSIGFMKSKWEQTYVLSRNGINKYSPTRRRIEVIRNSIGPCLDTDIYPYFAKNWKTFKNKYGTSKPPDTCRAILAEVRPKAVFVYGKPATNHLSEILEADLTVNRQDPDHPWYRLTAVKRPWGNLTVCSTIHLACRAKGWTDDQVEACAKELGRTYSGGQ